MAADAQLALADDLLDVARRFDRVGQTALAVPAEYLEVSVRRAEQPTRSAEPD